MLVKFEQNGMIRTTKNNMTKKVIYHVYHFQHFFGGIFFEKSLKMKQLHDTYYY